MKKLFSFTFASLLVFTAINVSAQSRRQPFRFQVAAVEAKTDQPRSTFFLGESVAVRFSLTNRSRVARKIPVLPDTGIKFRLHSTEPYEYAPQILTGYFGGTGFAEQRGDRTIWGSRPPRMMTIAPGQTVSTTIVLDELHRHPLEEGTHTFTAHYNSELRTTIMFRVIVDEARSFPLLEKLASTPVEKGNDTLQRWASATLNLARAPSISGRIMTSDGRPLNKVTILVTGTKNSNTESRRKGHYIADNLSEGGTYTITPSITDYHGLGETLYKLEPASKTITILNGKVTNVDFIAHRIRVDKNVALEDEGAKARASSIRDDDYEPEHVINGFRGVDGWGSGPDGWNDGTPNVFPDWIEVDFGRVQRINWINVFTLPDDYKNPHDPDLNEKFSLYGITDFDVQYWTGRAWLTVPGGAIRNNRNVWRMINLPAAVATNKIRVVVRNALGGESRITEIEAFHVNDLPEAKIVVDGKRNVSAMGHTNTAVHFRIDAVDRDGMIQYYELDFGDDTAEYEWRFDRTKPADKPRLTHSHVYESEGTYTVTLKVVDDSLEVTETTLLLTIIDAPRRDAKHTKTSKK